MDNNNQKRNIDPQKTSAEKLNGRFALVGVIALVGAYISTGQIVPGIIWIYIFRFTRKLIYSNIIKLKLGWR